MAFSKHHRWFLVACLFELSLLAVAAGLGWLLDQAPLAGFQWRIKDALWGCLATLPLLAAFRWVLRSHHRPLSDIRTLLERFLRPFFGRWSLLQLGLISLIAGVAEESLFRAVLQGGLSRILTPAGALVVASLLFGLCHLVTRTYGIFATMFGAYLGLLWYGTGNLLAPIAAHALYDFLALAYFLRSSRPDDRDGPPPFTS